MDTSRPSRDSEFETQLFNAFTRGPARQMHLLVSQRFRVVKAMLGAMAHEMDAIRAAAAPGRSVEGVVKRCPLIRFP